VSAGRLGRLERVETLARSLIVSDDDRALAADPVLFAERVGFTLDDWQVALLRSTARRLLILASRQAGKSTVTAIEATWMALYHPGTLILLLSPGLRQSGELLRKVVDTYRASGRAVPAEAETLLRLELANGSRIVALPGSEMTVRGYSAPALVILDEAARIDDELLVAVSPMLATAPAARLVLLSSPAGKRGVFWKSWDQGGDDWARVKVLATDIPRISADHLAAERRTMSAARFAQEYLCAFTEADGAVFAADAVSQAIDHGRAPLALDVLARWRTAS
jgi:hypothetical protein